MFNYPIAPHVVNKSVEFSSVGSLTHWVIINTYCAGALYSQYKISHVHDVWRDCNRRGQWTIAETELRCVLKLVSIPSLLFSSQVKTPYIYEDISIHTLLMEKYVLFGSGGIEKSHSCK